VGLEQDMTLSQLQEYIKQFDHNPEKRTAYFMKLIEEVGELSEVLRKGKRLSETGTIKGTIEEELCDVLYYLAALANVYDINLNKCFQLKDELNKVKWNR
jgi:NTP pyrophosphatase (non-canonical NTP hydrolase)